MAQSGASDYAFNSDHWSSLKGGGTWRNRIHRWIVLKWFNLSRQSKEL